MTRVGIHVGSAVDPNSLIPSEYFSGPVAQYLPSWRDVSGLTQYSPALAGGQNTVLIFAYGQSLIANHDNDSYSVVSSLNQQFFVENGGVYGMSSPCLGASWLVGSANRATYMTRLGDKLIADAFCARVIVVNVAIGSTVLSDFAAGGCYNQRLVVACRRLAAVGITASGLYRTFIIQHQGESHDCTLQSISAAAYAANGNSTLATIRNNGFPAAKAFVQLATLNGSTDSTTRTGQLAMVDSVTTFAGYDLDTNVAGGNRYDGTHLNSAGCVQVSNGTAAILEAH